MINQTVLRKAFAKIPGLSTEEADMTVDSITHARTAKDDIKNIQSDVDNIKDDIIDIKSRMATKDDIKNIQSDVDNIKDDIRDIESRMATKDDIIDIKSRMATKDDIKNMTTKSDVKDIVNMVVETKMAKMETRLIARLFGLAFAMTVLNIAAIGMMLRLLLLSN